MSFWKNIFSKGEQPVAHYKHSILGRMTWSEDNESWIGRIGQLNYWVAYEGMSIPKSETLEYATSILTDEDWQEASLKKIKATAIQNYGPDYEKEINNLAFVTLSFHSSEHLSIQFFEGDEQPWWIADIHGRNIEGVALDT